MKKCPLYNQHKFTIDCKLKPCFSHCHHNHEYPKHEEYIPEILPIQKPECNVFPTIIHDYHHVIHHYDDCIRINPGCEKPEIQKYNKMVFATYEDAYQHIINVPLLPGQQYVVYYKNTSSEFNGYSSILAIGNINVSAGNIIYMDKSYIDSIKNEYDDAILALTENYQRLQQSYNVLNDNVNNLLKKEIEDSKNNNE